MGNFGSNDTRTSWSEEMQDALLDTPLVVCQSACCISALIVLHTTSIMPHASQRQYILLSKAAHTIALVAFKISFLPTAFNYCKPVGEHPTFEIYLLSTLQSMIFQYFNRISLLVTIIGEVSSSQISLHSSCLPDSRHHRSP